MPPVTVTNTPIDSWSWLKGLQTQWARKTKTTPSFSSFSVMRTAPGFCTERLLCVCCHERLNTVKFCLASEAFGEVEWEGSNFQASAWLKVKWRVNTEELLVRECRSAGVCQDWLLAVTARLGERLLWQPQHKSQTLFSVSTTVVKNESLST